MRADIAPGGTFPDYELPDQDRVTRALSDDAHAATSSRTGQISTTLNP